MHKLIQIEKALKLLDHYDGQLVKASRELGISKHTLRSWRDKRKKNEHLLKGRESHHFKWTKEQRSQAIEYYFAHGENISLTCRKLGFPARTTLTEWVKLDKRWKAKHKIYIRNQSP